MEFLTIKTSETATLLLQAEMERFGKDRSKVVQVSEFGWDDIWREVVRAGIYRRGADVAEIGSTWLDSLVAMQSLNSFSAREIDQIGGKEIFLPVTWKHISGINRSDMWAIPFRVDPWVIFYWKDHFEKAGVDPNEAFSTFEQMSISFNTLQNAGFAPWIAPTGNARNTIYSIASWIWSAGGDFLSPDGKQSGLNSPAVRSSIRAYFDLVRFMPKHDTHLSDSDVTQLFSARKASVVIAGPWLANAIRFQEDAKAILPHLGAMLLPGPAFVGGTLLVSWKHSKYLFEPLDLIRRLISPEFQLKYCEATGMLPVRQDIWTDEFIHSNPYLPVFHQAIHQGRSLPFTVLSGMIEERLSNTFGAIWQDFYTQNEPDMDAIIAKHLDTLAINLDRTLATSNEPIAS